MSLMVKQAAIVFGGAGFIGRHLLTRLTNEGYTTICADLRPLDPAIPGVTSFICDVRKPIGPELVDNIDDSSVTVYNLAAVHRTPGHADREYYDTNVTGALNVTNFCRRQSIKNLVFTSSISVYGPSEDEKTEASPPAPESTYGASKLQAEGIHRGWQEGAQDRRLVIVRPAVIFGVGENGNFTRLAKALRQRRFLYPGRRDTIKACGYVHELISAIEYARSLDRSAFLFNFAYPKQYTIEEICDVFHDVGGLPVPLGTLPLAPVSIAAGGFEVLSHLGIRSDINRARVEKLVRSTRICPRALVDSGYKFGGNLDSAIAHWRDASNGSFT